MTEKTIITTYNEYQQLEELPTKDAELLKHAEEALAYSYSPYSNFKVGCALRLANGEIILGSNQENSSFPAGICAERSALLTAQHTFKNVNISEMAITVSSTDLEVESPLAPCGVCRQVMLETEMRQKTDYKIILKGSKGKIYTLSNAKSLLPIYFFEKRLKKHN